MKTLVFMASPNKMGNTSILLNNLLKEIKGEINIINVFNVKVKGCIDCKYCYTHNKCFIKDDMVNIYKKIDECDNLIIASPMYFSGFPSQMKAIIDRLQVYWSNKFIMKKKNYSKQKKGILIMTAGSKWENMFYGVETVIKQVFSITNCKELKKIYAVNTDKYPVSKDDDIKRKAYDIGKNICEF